MGLRVRNQPISALACVPTLEVADKRKTLGESENDSQCQGYDAKYVHVQANEEANVGAN